ncbi:MAG TPA: hypothetical protein VLX56_01510 [Nitrososphaerales archaeon]|nr:hypothetical protein [Nitrososphaerales archaeon]
MKNEMNRPDHVVPSGIPTETIIARSDRPAMHCVVAAGVTTKDRMRRTPVTCTENDTATPRRS